MQLENYLVSMNVQQGMWVNLFPPSLVMTECAQDKIDQTQHCTEPLRLVCLESQDQAYLLYC